MFHTCDTSPPATPSPIRSWRAGWTTSHLATCQHTAKVTRKLQGDSKWKYKERSVKPTNTRRDSQGIIRMIDIGVMETDTPLHFAHSGLFCLYCELGVSPY